MSDTLPSQPGPATLPAPRRSWIKTTLLGAVVLISGMIIGSGLTVIGIRRWADEMRQRPDMFSNRILARMEQDLKLTKEQKSELGKIFKATREELNEMRSQHRVQAQAFFRDFHDEVAHVLTPDQQKEWDTWWKRARERAFKERGVPPPRPGGPGRERVPRPEGASDFRPLDDLRGAPPQGIPERHFAPDPAAPGDESEPEPKRVPPPN